jgi:hypothetical protein
MLLVARILIELFIKNHIMHIIYSKIAYIHDDLSSTDIAGYVCAEEDS